MLSGSTESCVVACSSQNMFPEGTGDGPRPYTSEIETRGLESWLSLDVISEDWRAMSFSWPL